VRGERCELSKRNKPSKRANDDSPLRTARFGGAGIGENVRSVQCELGEHGERNTRNKRNKRANDDSPLRT